MHLLVATGSQVLRNEAGGASLIPAHGLADASPTCLSADVRSPGRAWCGTHRNGIYRSDDGGASWIHVGLVGRRIMAVAASPTIDDEVWAGTEPSELWRSDDAGATWERIPALEGLPSASEWAFPPRPDTHHVRWIACHPQEHDRLWVAIEAGALVSSADGGRTWRDRVVGGPYDTHELAIHPAAPETLHVSAGDGYYRSDDGGASWSSPIDGLEVGYLRSVAIDPGDPATVIVSAASHPHKAYMAGRADGRLYRRIGGGPWQRITNGWPGTPETIAPLLVRGTRGGELWAADERGLHRSRDGGRTWRTAAFFEDRPSNLRGLALVPVG